MSAPAARPARANTFHGGEGSSASDPDADCLRWELVLVTSDGAISDQVGADADPATGLGGSAGGGAPGAGTAGAAGGMAGTAGGGPGGAGGAAAAPDAGVTSPAPVVQLRCVEHATLFGCRCELGRAPTPIGLGALALGAAWWCLRTRQAARGRRRP